MLKSGIDQDALTQMFSQAAAKQSEQLRKTVHDATLKGLQGRELTLKNVQAVLKSVTQAATAGAAQNKAPTVDVEALLGGAVKGMDDALLKAVEANRVALSTFVSQGADLHEKHLKKAVGDLEKLEDLLFSTVAKAAESAGGSLETPWGHVLEQLKLSGTHTGAGAGQTITQLTEQMRTALRDTRASSLRAAQSLSESYAALVSGVLIGMSDALQQRGDTPPKPTPSRKKA